MLPASFKSCKSADGIWRSGLWVQAGAPGAQQAKCSERLPLANPVRKPRKVSWELEGKVGERLHPGWRESGWNSCKACSNYSAFSMGKGESSVNPPTHTSAHTYTPQKNPRTSLGVRLKCMGQFEQLSLHPVSPQFELPGGVWGCFCCSGKLWNKTQQNKGLNGVCVCVCAWRVQKPFFDLEFKIFDTAMDH